MGFSFFIISLKKKSLFHSQVDDLSIVQAFVPVTVTVAVVMVVVVVVKGSHSVPNNLCQSSRLGHSRQSLGPRHRHRPRRICPLLDPTRLPSTSIPLSIIDYPLQRAVHLCRQIHTIVAHTQYSNGTRATHERAPADLSPTSTASSGAGASTVVGADIPCILGPLPRRGLQNRIEICLMPIVPSGLGSCTPMAAVEMVVAVELLVDIRVDAILVGNRSCCCWEYVGLVKSAAQTMSNTEQMMIPNQPMLYNRAAQYTSPPPLPPPLPPLSPPPLLLGLLLPPRRKRKGDLKGSEK